MVTLVAPPPRDEISLLASLNGEWIKLPLLVMRDVGPAAQTLGGILKITNRETFVSAGKLAHRARLPVATVRKHLATLRNKGWVDNVGRCDTRAGRARRTCTLRLATKTKSAMCEYSILPWWACCAITRVGRLPWSAKALVSVIMARLAALKKAVEDQEGETDDDEFWGSLDNMGGEDRFRFSLDRLQADTALHRESIVDAKRRLADLGIVEWIGTRSGADGADILYPNQSFRVVVTPASEGCCHISFNGGSDSGQ